MTAAGRERDWWMFPFWVVLDSTRPPPGCLVSEVLATRG
jgi:hypothetical protein